MPPGRILVRGSAGAQTYSHQPVRIVVPFAAGGAVDSVARVVGQKLSEIDRPAGRHREPAGRGRKPGRRGASPRAAPDGYTILLTTNGHSDQPFALPRVALRCDQRLRPGDAAHRVAAAAGRFQQSCRQNSLKELIALAKEKPGKLNYGSTGVGTPLPRLSMECSNTRPGIDVPGRSVSRRCAP